MTLPEATTQPCNDCPWRRNAAPGWLGPMTADEWLLLGHSDQPIACHLTIEEGVVEGKWDQPGLRQCAGAAIYRRNVCKRVFDESDASHSFTADRERVFATPMEFTAHHKLS